MFDDPEYASYIELCRELGLEREYDTFDAILDPNLGVMEWGWWTERQNRRDRPEDLIWLPRLDQWLAMLEEATHGDIRLWQQFWGSDKSRYWIATSYGHYAQELSDIRAVSRGESRTREEAAARLWMAVTRTASVPASR